MGLLDIFNPLAAVGGAVTGLGGLILNAQNRDFLRGLVPDSAMSKTPALSYPDQNIDFSAFPDHIRNSPENQQAYRDAVMAAPGGAALNADYQGEVGAQNRRQGYLQENLDTQKGAMGGTLNKLDSIINDPNIISQGEIDQMVARQVAQNNAAAASRARSASDAGAATGLSPAAIQSLRQQSAVANDSANSLAGRDFQIANAQNRADLLMRALGMRGSLGQGHADAVGNALLGLTQNAQNIPISPISDRAVAFGEGRLGQSVGANSDFANMLLATGGNLFGTGMSGWAQTRAADRAANAQPDIWDIMAGNLGGGVAGGLGYGLAGGLGNFLSPVGAGGYIPFAGF